MSAPSFEPFSLFKEGNVQTIVSSFWSGDTTLIPHRRENRKVTTRDGDTILVHSHLLPPEGKSRDTLLLIHGLEGSAESAYMMRLTAKALRRGFHVHRMNLRGCGPGLSLSRLAYHAGLWSDVKDVIASLQEVDRLFLIGISLGGNMILKMAGDREAELRSSVTGMAAISPPLDLMNCISWLDRHPFYRKYFLAYLTRNYRRRKALFPEIYSGRLQKRPRTIFEFDDYVTAAIHNFQGAKDYYFRVSCGRVLHYIKVPTLVIYAEDDPIVPSSNYRDYQDVFRRHDHISLLHTRNGGHVAFIGNSVPSGDVDRFWADERIFSFFARL